MAKAHADLAEGHCLELEMLKAKLEGRATALKEKLEFANGARMPPRRL